MAMSLDDLANSEAFGGNRGRREQVTWLPEPTPREPTYTVISVDDHVVEPPDAFTGRFPRRFASEEPRVVPTDDGGEAWVWQGQQLPNVGFNAVVGRPSSEYGFEPTRFDEMRRGAWDVHARVADMDIDGVWASLCFPSFLPGFVGQRLTLWPDSDELALAAMRAYNDWHLDAWCGAHPDRFIPNQIAYLRDPDIAADEIRRNAARGFKAVTFSEAPDKLGLPTIHSGHWDPLFAACEETGTVLCLHVGSSGTSPTTSPDAPPRDPGRAVRRVRHVQRGRLALLEGARAIPRYSHLPLRGRHRMGRRHPRPPRPLLPVSTRLPPDVARRRPAAQRDIAPQLLVLRARRRCRDARRDRIGVEHILVESDYPACRLVVARHASHARSAATRAGRTGREARRITWQNASELFRHPVPDALRR